MPTTDSRSSFGLTAIAAAVVATTLPATLAAAQFDLPGQPPRHQSASDVASVRVLTDKSAVAAGESFNLVVIFNTEPRWHIYWKNPGEGAAAPDLRINAPEGFKVGDIHWPRPKVVSSPIGDLYCHEGRTALFVPITAPPQVTGRDASFTIDVGYAVCDSEKCFFGRASLNASVKTTTDAGDGNADEVAEAALIERHRKRLPALVKKTDEADAQLAGTGAMRRLTITGPAHGHTDAVFFPYNSPGVRYVKPDVTFKDDRFTAVIELLINPSNFTRGAPKVGGLLALGTKIDDPSYEVEFSLEPSSQPAAP